MSNTEKVEPGNTENEKQAAPIAESAEKQVEIKAEVKEEIEEKEQVEPMSFSQQLEKNGRITDFDEWANKTVLSIAIGSLYGAAKGHQQGKIKAQEAVDEAKKVAKSTFYLRDTYNKTLSREVLSQVACYVRMCVGLC